MRHFLLLCFLLSQVVSAQQTGSIFGTVLNEEGIPVSNARVVISNQVNGSEIDCYTHADGSYKAANLDPSSRYTAEASQQKYQNLSHPNLLVSATASLEVDFVLKVKPASPLAMPAQGTTLYLVFTTMLTGIIGGLVVIVFTDPGKALARKIGRVGTWIMDKFYEQLAHRFPTMVGLRGYRTRVLRSDLARIEHPVGPGDSEGVSLSLDRAFAPLAVMTGEGEERVDLFPYADSHMRFIVLGGPGTGKTTLMKNLIISSLKNKTSSGLSDLVPVFVVLREMSVAGHTVEQALVASLARFRFKHAEAFIASLLESGRLLIILDGLDEVGANRDKVSGEIRAFCLAEDQRAQHNRVVLTCRENSYRVRDLADVISSVTRVEPFSPQHMRTFLQGWPIYKGRLALKLHPQIQADPQILDICRNPLLLTLLVGLYLAKDRFDLPSSRRAFYDTAIDELLVQRPARKQQKQDYSKEQKLPILQRAALSSLETLGVDEDPELLRREKLFECAQQVLGASLKESEFQALLNELDAVNSIVKPAFEGGFVFGHRTFQEYLAAREANRTRTEEEVVKRFGSRVELSEVLCFYCGLITKIPTIDFILTTVLESGDSVLASRCLLNVIETPSSNVVAAIVDALHKRIADSASYTIALDILSSLSRRPAAEFDIARLRFSEAIDSITTSSDQGSAGFVSALSANSALSMSLIPGLLRHKSASWRMQAVALLYNLGTDDALQYLMQVVNSQGSPEREWAAIWISNLIRTRNAQIKGMQDLFPERKSNLSIWPFEGYFPGRIAMTLIEAIEQGEGEITINTLGNACVEAAIMFRSGSHGSWSAHLWRNVGIYAQLNNRIKSIAKFCRLALPGLILLLATAAFALKVVGDFSDRAFLIKVWPPSISVYSAKPLEELARTAGQIQADIEHRYPPVPKGFARILPWNWVQKPSIPKSADLAFDQIKKLALGTAGGNRLDVNWIDLDKQLRLLQVPASTISDFEFNGHLALSHSAASWKELSIEGSEKRSQDLGAGGIGLLAGIAGLWLLLFPGSMVKFSASAKSMNWFTVMFYAVLMLIIGAGLQGGLSGTWSTVLWGCILGIAFLAMLALDSALKNEKKARFLPNPYIDLIEDLQPLTNEEDLDVEADDQPEAQPELQGSSSAQA